MDKVACMAKGHWDAFDSCGFHSFDCIDMLIWKTNPYLPLESHNNASQARIRYDNNFNAGQMWESEVQKLMVFSPWGVKGPLV